MCKAHQIQNSFSFNPKTLNSIDLASCHKPLTSILTWPQLIVILVLKIWLPSNLIQVEDWMAHKASHKQPWLRSFNSLIMQVLSGLQVQSGKFLCRPKHTYTARGRGASMLLIAKTLLLNYEGGENNEKEGTYIWHRIGSREQTEKTDPRQGHRSYQNTDCRPADMPVSLVHILEFNMNLYIRTGSKCNP